MTISITDPALLAQLDASAGVVELTAPDGRVVGMFTAAGWGKLPPGVKSPFTDEELAELRKQRTGRPLRDILADLREKYGE